MVPGTNFNNWCRGQISTIGAGDEFPQVVPGTDFTRAVLSSALGHLGDIGGARRVWHELKEINPQYSFSEHFARQPFTSQEDVRRIADGLAKAELPR